MDKIIEWKEITLASLKTFWAEFAKIFPNIIGALVVVFFGWLITIVIVFILKRALKLLKVNRLDDKINALDAFNKKSIRFNSIKIISKTVKYVLLLIIIGVAADILGLKMLTNGITSFLEYLPKLLSGFLLLLVGIFIANAIKNALKTFFKSAEISGGNFISQLIYVLIVLFVAITALNQASVNTSLITNNVTLIVGAFFAAFAIALGLGSRNAIGQLFNAYYTRRTFKIGQTVVYKDINGVIESVNDISVTIASENSKHIVPINDFMNSLVEIKG